MLANSVSTTVNTMPLLKDLHRYIVPQYAVQWKVIGTQLGLRTEILDIIEYENINKAWDCCRAMLIEWLRMDPTASWRKLFTIIESPAVSTPDRGDYLCSYIVSYACVAM